jgi:hypothetical protein
VIVMVQAVTVLVVVFVMVAVAGHLEYEKADPCGDQDAANDRVLRMLDRRAKLQTDHDDQRTKPDRDQHVRQPSQPRQARDPRKRVPPRAAEHSQRHPMVGQDGVPESDARCGGEEGWPGTTHAV